MRTIHLRSILAVVSAATLATALAACAGAAAPGGGHVSMEGACASEPVVEALRDYRNQGVTVADVTVTALGSGRRVAEAQGAMVYTPISVGSVHTITGSALDRTQLWVKGGVADGLTVDAGEQSGPATGQRAYVAVIDQPGLGPLVLDTFPVTGDEVLLEPAACHQPGSLAGRSGSSRVRQIRDGSSRAVTVAGTLVPRAAFERALRGS